MNDSGNYDIFEGLSGIVKGLETFAYALNSIKSIAIKGTVFGQVQVCMSMYRFLSSPMAQIPSTTLTLPDSVISRKMRLHPENVVKKLPIALSLLLSGQTEITAPFPILWILPRRFLQSTRC